MFFRGLNEAQLTKAFRCTVRRTPPRASMKIISNILFYLSLFWLLAVALFNAASLLQPVFPQLNWPHWLSRVPLPRPTTAFEWAASWPFFVGIAGMLVSVGLFICAERRRTRKRLGEI